jgi:RNA polymerase sigma-70 factor, ECF subfamily
MRTDAQCLKDGPFEDEFLVRAIADARAGDRSAVHFLYVRYADDVYRLVLRLVRDVHEAEDLTQSVFAKVITAIHRYERRDVPFAAWIQRIARNAALDHLRRKRATPSDLADRSDGGNSHERLHRTQTLLSALRELPREQREVLVLRHVAGLSPVEIAGLLGKSEGSVNGLHHRGRKTLQARLREMHVAPVTAAA